MSRKLIERACELLADELGVDAQAVARAPGRVNLIGEHTDYNDGFVMPFATNLATYVACARRPDGIVRVHSEAYDETFQFDLANIGSASGNWADYVRGVAWSLQARGVRLRGVDLAIVSDVPVGGGVSSSAALEVAAAMALLWAAGALGQLSERDIALLCQRAENEFVGMQCGVMDQLAAVWGKRDAALLIDCWTLEHEQVPLPSEQVAVVVMDTGKPRELVDSEYNLRRKQCQEVARVLRIRSLRDADMEMLHEAYEQGRIDELSYRRARHVITENERVFETAQALRDGDFEKVGQMLNESHMSLRDDYEVSCPELDLICEIAREHDACYGARLVGAGFGGCAIALVQAGAEEQFAQAVKAEYDRRSCRNGAAFAVRAADGAQIVWEA